MPNHLDLAYAAVERVHDDQPAATRRRFVAGAAATIGSMGVLGALPKSAFAANSAEEILTVAATAEVLATIVNTVGYRKRLGGDRTTQRNIGAAAREELVHYNVLVGALGARPDLNTFTPVAL
jgi:hypothetical protein